MQLKIPKRKSLLRVARLLAILTIAIFGDEVRAARAVDEAGAQHEERLDWWRNARFGMFIHWGPVSLRGTEISWSRAAPRQGCPSKAKGTVPVEEYDNLYKQFNPAQFDAEAWVALAQEAGMKYMV